MNLALNRAAAYIEENAGVLSHLDHINNPLNRQAEGQDLTGPDLREFWGAFGEEKQTFLKPDLDFEIQQLQIEEDFWNNFLLNKLEESPNLVILAIALDSDVNAVLSHEVLHAQYFKNEVFQDVVSDFWKDNVLLEDKKAIKRKLSPYYDVDNEELLINEFQAYILMNNAENNELGFLVPKYREGLMAELLENDIEPIQLSIVLEENND